MADRTTQPATEVGPHSAYAANCRFLWNAAVPNKNSLNSNDSTSGLKGTDHTGTAGKYRTFGADGQMTFAVTFPTGAYTLIVVHAFPTALIGSTQTVTTASGTGFQCTPYTTGGGVYENYTHRGVADSTQNQVTGVGGFDTAPWVEVFAWSGAGGSPANQLRRYRKSGSGVETQGTETVSYVAPSTTIYLGSSLAANTQGVYAVMLVDGDIGATECELLRDNPWRMFEEEGGGTATPTPADGVATVAVIGESLAESTVTAAAGAATVSVVGGTLTVITSSAFKNNTGTVLASLTNVTAWVYNPTTGALVVKLTGQTTNASGVLTLNDAAIVSATTYRVVYRNEDDGAEGMETVTAS